MKKLQLICVILSLVVVSVTLTPKTALAQSEEHVVIIIDRSGSMTITRDDGTTRFDSAIKLALDFLNEVYPVKRWYAVWSFHSTSYIQHLDFTDNPFIVRETLNKIMSPQPSFLTPLAMTVCDLIELLVNYQPNILAYKRIALFTDGEENNTPLDHKCYGPDSNTLYPDLEEGSWEWKVRNMAMNFDPTNDNQGPYRIIMDIKGLFVYITYAYNSSFVSDDFEYVPHSRRALNTSSPVSMYEFFKGIAEESGGTYVHISDDDPLPQLGDVNGDQCVDATDYAIVMSHFGQSVPPADQRADLNHDQVVNIYDRIIVIQNYGEGC